jgi:hypothetical protein
VSTVLIVNTRALPAFKSSHGPSAPPGVIYAQELRYGHAPSLGTFRAFNAGYVQDGSEDLGYSQDSRFGYAEGSNRHFYNYMNNYVSNNILLYDYRLVVFILQPVSLKFQERVCKKRI